MLKWIALVLVAALAAVLLWQVTGIEEAPLDVTPTEAPTQPEGGDDALVETSLTPVGNSAGTGRRELVPSAPTLQGAPLEAELESTIAVRVVSQANGRPAVDAEILFLNRLEVPTESWEAVWYGNGDIADFVEKNGQRFRTDESGMLRVPRTTSGALVARVPRHKGVIDWAGIPEEPITLPLLPLPDVVVQVVNADGNYVPGVPVAVCMNRPELPWNVVVRSTNNIDGSAPFMNLDKIIRNPDADPGYAVGFAFPLATRELVPIHLSALPEDPIRLELPPTGSVTVTLKNDRGEPFASGAQISLGRTTIGTGGRESFRTETAARLTQGRAFFQFVGVNTQLTIRVDGVAEMRPMEVMRGGPTQEGEAKTIDLVWSDQQTVVVGRAVLADGTAIASRNGRFMVEENMLRRGGAALSTDIGGRFRAVVRDPWTEGMIRTGEFFFYPNANAGLPSLDAELDLTYALQPGENDVGDVLFEALPLLVAGQVTDPGGQPLPGAMIFVETPYTDKAGGVAWKLGRDLSASADEEGRFEIYGRLTDPEMRARSSMRGMRTAYSDLIPVGTTGLALTMIPGEDPKPENVGASREKGK